MSRIGLVVAVLGVFFVLGWHHAHAVITAPTPLKKFEGDAVYILVGKVEKYYPEKPAMMVNAVDDIKGKAPFRQLPINCKVADEKDFKQNLIEPLLKRFGPEMEIIFFLTPHGKKSYITFAYANGTWFQLHGTKVDKDGVVFNLKSAEPYFRKAFKGTTEELRKLLKEHAAGKAKLPELNDKEKPGLGPEYKEKGERKKEKVGAPGKNFFLFTSYSTLDSGASLFAVIPTVGLGAPLAILALLFPTVFGGVFVLFRQWMALITVISLNSALMIVHWLLMEYQPALLRNTWWSTEASLWFLMTMFTFACAIWAWRRQLDALSAGDTDVPQRTELLVLAFMTVSCVATTIVLWFITEKISWSGDIGWTLTVVMTLGVLAGTLYKCRNAFRTPAPFGSMPVTTEGVVLGAMLLGHLAFVPAILAGNVNTAGSVEGGQQSGNLSAQVAPVVKKWDFTVDPAIKGMFASPPIVHGDAVYAAYSRTNGYAVLVRLDRQDGAKKWECFGKDDDLRQLISTPCLADGKLYFGEGFHFDKNCHVFCIDAASGDEVWRFKTAGQTESSPTVVNGKVYIGAGNDGVYCLDAKDGKKVWQYPQEAAPDQPRIGFKERLLRFGGGMVVVGDKLYCGTGIDRAQENDKGETAVLCFDANDGKLLWKAPAPFPVWSTPVIKDGRIYVTSGNGDVFLDATAPERKGGALQCLDANNKGAEIWRVTLDNGVIGSPAVDAHRIYFGCRNKKVYCVSRADGKERWKRDLGSAIVAAPVLDCDPLYERSLNVFTLSTAGNVCCLNPRTGEIVWRYDLTAQNAAISTSPRLVVTRTPEGYTRQLYFGCGLGGGTSAFNENRPVLYCLEDKVIVE